MRALLLGACALFFASCTPKIPEGVFACSDDDQCPSGWSCDLASSRCHSGPLVHGDAGSDADVEEPGDAGSDGEVADAGFDAEVTDAGACPVGYTFTGGNCVDVDECARRTDDCDPNATCTNTLGGFSCACNYGYSGTGTSCARTCNLATDLDVLTKTYVFTHLTTAANSGYDYDGINNASGFGTTIPGCGKLDYTGGIDNSLDALATSLSSAIDVSGAYQASLSATPPTSVEVGKMQIVMKLDHLVAVDGTDDPCVGVTLSIATRGSVVPIAATGVVQANVVHVDFGNSMALFDLTLPNSGFCNGACSTAGLRFSARHLRADFALDSTRTTILSGRLGAVHFFEDVSGSGYDPSNAAPYGLKSAFAVYGNDANWQANFVTMIQMAFEGARDLHLGTNMLLAPCTGTSNTMNDRNAISAAYSFDSMP